TPSDLNSSESTSSTEQPTLDAQEELESNVQSPETVTESDAGPGSKIGLRKITMQQDHKQKKIGKKLKNEIIEMLSYSISSNNNEDEVNGNINNSNLQDDDEQVQLYGNLLESELENKVIMNLLASEYNTDKANQQQQIPTINTLNQSNQDKPDKQSSSLIEVGQCLCALLQPLVAPLDDVGLTNTSIQSLLTFPHTQTNKKKQSNLYSQSYQYSSSQTSTLHAHSQHHIKLEELQ
ncbi:MAG: hypothetical protein EZS28_051035, partial [Streblomastix strix]